MARKFEQRICIKFCYKIGKSASETFDLLKLAFGNENVNKPTTFRWFSRFKNGMESMKDDKRVGRPILHRNPEKVSQISNLIKENPRIGLRDIEKETGISKSLVESIIKEDLQLKKTISKFVPKMLTIQQKENRVEVAKKMLEMVEEHPNWKEKVILGDETWVYGSLLKCPNPAFPAMYEPLVVQLLQDMFSPSELPDLTFHQQTGHRLVSGFNLFTKNPRPQDNPVLILVVVGGISASEVCQLRQVALKHPSHQKAFSDGSQIRELLQDGNFQNSLNEVEAVSMEFLRNVCNNFLGSVKVEN
ncbi:hypothetical protein LAZ67_10002588 [Cordylochernes scorpioides]|uniref:Mos1 transposase HTH domain-containing protein n=1 Tax=Cordylochernes scorpioides TaxID=51811 RepID=A0ABY6KWQ4_9ARAC|nr:hypothetical protein LAZ67_10002588 [Cordylochernes scorpioides]